LESGTGGLLVSFETDAPYPSVAIQTLGLNSFQPIFFEIQNQPERRAGLATPLQQKR
jgi:hypothetical protein